MAKRKTASLNDNVPPVFRTHCNSCGQTTVHDVLCGVSDDLVGPVIPPGSKVAHEEVIGLQLRMIVGCQGCGTRAFAHFVDDYTRGDHTYNYPRITLRRVPDWYLAAVLNTEFDLLTLYGEVYEAVNNGSFRLAAIGIRSVLESMIVYKAGDHGTFKNNVEAFYAAGYISAKDVQVVMKVIEVGNAATHRSHEPSEEDVMRMLDITEHVMKSVYANSELASQIRAVPPRPRKNLQSTLPHKSGPSSDLKEKDVKSRGVSGPDSKQEI